MPRQGLLVLALAETGNHRLWIGTRDAGLLSLENGRVQDFSRKVPDLKVNSILPDGDDRLWIGTDGGVIRWNGSALTDAGVPKELKKAQIVTLARDHEANVGSPPAKASIASPRTVINPPCAPTVSPP